MPDWGNHLDSSDWTDAQALGYIASYPDLIAAFGANASAAKQHYATDGAREGRVISFDALKYIASYSDLRTALGTDEAAGARHFILFGSSEGRTSTFDGLKYIASYGDLISAFGTDQMAAARHFITFGAKEGRAATFDALGYVASYADLIAAFGIDESAAARHYITSGVKEGRTATFDAMRYLASYNDLLFTFGTDQAAAKMHFIRSGHQEGRVSGFDAVAYLLTHSDLGAAQLGASGALAHWVAFGFKEGRAGDQLFGREQTQHVLAIGSSRHDLIERAGDRDWFQVSANAADLIRIDFKLAQGQSSSSIPAVYDSKGQAIQLFLTMTGTDQPTTIVFKAPSDGIYYVVASGDGLRANSYAITASYYFVPKAGTSGNDTLVGTDGRDLLQGLEGSDILEGRAGDDILEGGAGYDQLNGGLGDDTLYGNNADNSGVDGGDYLVDDQGGNDRLFGQDGNDYIYVRRDGKMAASAVLLDGGSGDDILDFSSDRLADTVTVLGGAGDDTILVGRALNATIDAGDGNDKVTIDTLGGTKTVTLGKGADVLTLARTFGSFASGNSIRVTDFENGTDTVSLDKYLADVLIGWDGTNPFATGHLKLVQSGTDTLLQIDRDGSAGTSHSPGTLLIFSNRSLDSFTAADLGYAPSAQGALGLESALAAEHADAQASHPAHDWWAVPAHGSWLLW